MRGKEFAELQAFAAVAALRSFSRAAEQLGMSTSSLSVVIQELEARVGLRLLHRTTRRVSLTEGGARLNERLVPLLGELGAMLDDLADLRDTPSGTVRLLTPRIAFVDTVEPLLGRFNQAFPQITLDITVDDAITDLVIGSFDIGIRLGEFLEDTVVAFPISRRHRQVAAASPAYLAQFGTPQHPDELRAHRCINWRQHGTVRPYLWEFEKGEKKLAVAVKGPLTVNDRSLTLSAAVQGMGITMWADHRLQPLVEKGKLALVLEDWCPWFPGFFAYFPKQHNMPVALRTFSDFLRQQTAGDVMAAER